MDNNKIASILEEMLSMFILGTLLALMFAIGYQVAKYKYTRLKEEPMSTSSTELMTQLKSVPFTALTSGEKKDNE